MNQRLDELKRAWENNRQNCARVDERSLGFSLLDAKRYLESVGIRPVFEPLLDYNLKTSTKEYTSKSSFIGVHKTDYMPHNNTILTKKC